MEFSSFEQLTNGQPTQLDDASIISLDFFDTLAERIKPEITVVEELFHVFHLKHRLNLDLQQFLLLREQAYAEVGSTNGIDNKDRELTTIQWYQAVLQLAGCVDFKSLGRQFSEELAKLEAANLRLNAHIKLFLSKCVERQQRLLILSDTYYTPKQFQVFLNTLEIEQYISHCYLSCELGLNKASGKMFKHVLQTEQLGKDQLIHIGDNPNGDFVQPQKHHIKSFLYRRESSNLTSGKEQQRLQQALFDFGALTLGPVLIAFCCWLKTQLQEKQHVAFLARDSYFLFNLYRHLFPKTNIQYAYINRVIVNQLEYQELNKQTLDFVDRSYRAEGLEGLEKAFGLYDTSFSAALTTFCQNMACSKDSLLESDLTQAILNDKQLCEQFSLSLNRRKSSSIQYLQGLFATQSSPLALVDIGWRGTIYTVLSKHIDTPLQGFLLCSVSATQPGLTAMVDERTEGDILTTLSEYRDLIEWAGSEDKGAILYINERLKPVFANKNLQIDFAKQTVQQGIWQCLDSHKSREINRELAFINIQNFFQNIPKDFCTAMGNVNTELGIDGTSAVSFNDMLSSNSEDPQQSTPLALQKQAMVNTFLDLVEQLQEAKQVVIYGAGSGFNFVMPHLAGKVNWVVDINSKLHGKTIQHVPIHALKSLDAVEGILLVSVIGRKAQISPLVNGLSCKVIFLEDFL